MPLVPLGTVAHARSGDKGGNSNVGIIAYSPEVYDYLKTHLTATLVTEYFTGIVHGPVTRYELDNLLALNFILGDSLGGGGSESLLNDAQGKTHGQKLLQLKIELPDELLKTVQARH